MKLPEICLGTAAIAGIIESCSEDEAHSVLNHAWKSGIRFYDTAPHYGHGLAERRVGDFLRDKNSDTYILSTKVGRLLSPDSSVKGTINSFVDPLPFLQKRDYSYDGIMRSVEDSFQRLGLAKIDILYVHDLGSFSLGDQSEFYFDQFITSGYRALEELKNSKVIKSFGLGVNETAVCIDVIQRCDLDIILLAGRYTFLDRSAADTFLPLCTEKNIDVVVGATFNSGILVTGAKAGALYNYKPASDEILNRVNALEEQCAKFHIPLPAAAINFPLRHNQVKSVITGPGKLAHLKQNLELLSTPISEEFWNQIN
ncbi:aldo/keto reductase [Ahrensia kielensis]|uniref:Aldo/keto reductase n=1 Tax=Ahrensia kielensis TaxID=76980 RepID=A0ABU9T9Z1_9HYPH